MPRILGIDPGSLITGFGVIDVDGPRCTYVGSGRIKTAQGAFNERLQVIYEGVCGLLDEYMPHEFAIESVFVHRNANSALKLGHARAAAICATFGHGLAFAEYAPREIKLAVVGTGDADKTQVQNMVMRLLELDAEPQADTADALAIALCHAHQRGTRAATGLPTGRRRGRAR